MTWPHVSVYIVIHFFNSISSTVPYYFQKIKARLILYIFLIFELVLLNKRQQGSSKAHAPRQAWNAFSVLSAGNILTHITLTCIISMMQGEKLNGRNTNTSIVFQKIIAYRSEAHFAAIWQSWGEEIKTPPWWVTAILAGANRKAAFDFLTNNPPCDLLHLLAAF